MLRWLSLPPPVIAGANARAYGMSGLIVVAATLACFLLNGLPSANLALVFLMSVIFSAALFGTGPAIAASILSVFSFNYFFTAPQFTLRVDSREDIATLLLFLLIAAVTGNLAARMRGAIEQTNHALERTSSLYQFSRAMNASSNSQEILRTLTKRAADLCDAPAAIFTRDASEAPVLAAWERDRPGPQAGRVGDESPVQTVVEFGTPRQRFGQLVVEGVTLKEERLELVAALTELAALAYERARLADDLEQAQVAAETERLRSALLSSVSHDLRTPLASIIGGASSLLDLEHSLDERARRELQTGILIEAEKLNRYIQNLLDMTRFGRGDIVLKRDWVDLSDVVSGALARLQRDLSAFRVAVDLQPDATLIYANGAFLEQMVVNLLDNAARYSPAGGVITIASRRQEGAIILEVIDEGAGVPESERERIFNMFYSADKGDRGAKGIGLGLAICRAIANAHKGSIAAIPGLAGRGTCMQVTLPAGEAPPEEASDE